MPFGLLSYTGTGNLGDEIQSLAAAGHLPRVDFHLDRDDLGEAGHRLETHASVIMNGWYCQFPERWPPSPKVRPLFVSMHISQEKVSSKVSVRPSEFLLTPPVSSYLREHGPIGARDRTTKTLLEAAGIESYFSGCMTLTLKRRDVPRNDDLVIFNDLPTALSLELRERTRKKVFSTWHTDLEEKDRRQRMARAEELLQLYARASCVVTTRLHCALPCLGMGTPVLLLNTAADQYRFAGLRELTHNCTIDDYLGGRFRYDLDRPPENKGWHEPFRRGLTRRVVTFIEEDAGFVPTAAAMPRQMTMEAIRAIYARTGRPVPQWVALQDTAIKTQTVPSALLQEQDRRYVPSGAVLSGSATRDDGEHRFMANMHLNGQPIPGDRWCIYRPHWAVLDEPRAATA